MPRPLTLCALTLALLLTGCKGTPTVAPADAPPAPEAVASPETPVPSEAPMPTPADALPRPALPEVVDVVEVQQGDRACYLRVRGDGGAEQTLMAAFDLCVDAWAGQRVRATYAEADVMAMSCEGDPSCTETERVALVVALEPMVP